MLKLHRIRRRMRPPPPPPHLCSQVWPRRFPPLLRPGIPLPPHPGSQDPGQQKQPQQPQQHQQPQQPLQPLQPQQQHQRHRRIFWRISHRLPLPPPQWGVIGLIVGACSAFFTGVSVTFQGTFQNKYFSFNHYIYHFFCYSGGVLSKEARVSTEARGGVEMAGKQFILKHWELFNNLLIF